MFTFNHSMQSSQRWSQRISCSMSINSICDTHCMKPFLIKEVEPV